MSKSIEIVDRKMKTLQQPRGGKEKIRTKKSNAFVFGDGVMKKETKQEVGCDCFMCRHGKDKRVLKAYLIGFLEQTENKLNELQEAGVKEGKINDNDILRRLYAELKYDKEATCCFLSELEDVVL